MALFTPTEQHFQRIKWDSLMLSRFFVPVALPATAFSFAFIAGSIVSSVWFPFSIFLVIATVFTSLNTRFSVFSAAMLAVMVVFGLIAVYTSYQEERAWFYMSISLLWPAGYGAIIFARIRHDVIYWLFPVAFVQAFAMIIEGMNGMIRANGLVNSPNPAGGLMAFMAVLLMGTRFKYFSPILILAMFWSGSRLAALSLVAGAIVLAFTDRISGKALIIIAVMSLALYLPFRGAIDTGYTKFHQGKMSNVEAVVKRVPIPEKIGFFGHGYLPVNGDSLHNVPLQIAFQFGIPAALAWIALALRGFKRLRHSPLLAPFIVLIALSTLDFYTWIGPMAWAWWLLMTIPPHPPASPVVLLPDEPLTAPE